jgi:chaperonin GroES
MTLQPLGTRVLVKPLEQDSMTSGGIYLPETAKEKPQQGLVVAIGEDETIKVKPQDKVLFAKYTGTEVQLGGANHLILEANDILARVAD